MSDVPAAKSRMILATSSDGLPADFERTGFHPFASEDALEALQSAGLWIGSRATLEASPEYRQIIPYVVLKYGDRVVRYTRTPAGGEARLHGRMSVGLGGHIDFSDIVAVDDRVDLSATVKRAAEREVEEELGDVAIESQDWVGVLVDNESEVGRVHIGLVGVWTLLSLPNSVPEDAIGDVTLCELPTLLGVRDRLEGWSELLLDYLGETYVEAQRGVAA